jgi:hypothetical protein
MGQEKAWRLGNAGFLKGMTFVRRRWWSYREGWDHDHCEACWAKLSDSGGSEVLHEGYTTTADHEQGEGYHWVCPQCFLDLKEDLQWRLQSDA